MFCFVVFSALLAVSAAELHGPRLHAIAQERICGRDQIDLIQANEQEWALIDQFSCESIGDSSDSWDPRATLPANLGDFEDGTGSTIWEDSVKCTVKLSQPIMLQSFSAMVSMWSSWNSDSVKQLATFVFEVDGEEHRVVGAATNLGREQNFGEWMNNAYFRGGKAQSTTARDVPIPLSFADDEITEFTLMFGSMRELPSFKPRVLLTFHELRLCAKLAETANADAAKVVKPWTTPTLKDSYVTQEYQNRVWGAIHSSGDINAAQLIALKDSFLENLVIEPLAGAPTNFDALWDRKTSLYELSTPSGVSNEDAPRLHIAFTTKERVSQGQFRLLMNGECTIRARRENSEFKWESIRGSLDGEYMSYSRPGSALSWKGMRAWTDAQKGYLEYDFELMAHAGETCRIAELHFFVEPVPGTAMRKKIEDGLYTDKISAPWPSPWETGYDGLEHATFTQSGPWIAAVCFECDSELPSVGDYVQIVGQKADLVGSTLLYEVNERNITLATFKAAELTDNDDGTCSWIVSKKSGLKCSGTCDFSRSALRRFFLIGADNEPQAVFVARPYKADEKEFVQVRNDRTSTELAFIDEAEPRYYSQECESSTGNGAEARMDVEASAAATAVPHLVLLACVLAVGN